MIPAFRFARVTGLASIACFSLAAIDHYTGLVGRIAPTEAHAFIWGCAIGLVILAIRAARGMRLPAFGLKWPTPKYARQRRYAQRQRRIVP